MKMGVTAVSPCLEGGTGISGCGGPGISGCGGPRRSLYGPDRDENDFHMLNPMNEY